MCVRHICAPGEHMGKLLDMFKYTLQLAELKLPSSKAKIYIYTLITQDRDIYGQYKYSERILK